MTGEERKVKWDAERALDPFLYAAGFEKVALETVLEAIGLTWPLVAWLAAHKAHAAALISGEAVVASAMCPSCGQAFDPDCGQRKNAIDMGEEIPCRRLAASPASEKETP